MNEIGIWLQSAGSSVYALLLFASVCLAIYYIAPVRARVWVLFAESVAFYALCDLRFLLLVVGEAAVSWGIGLALDPPSGKSRDNRSRKNALLAAGVILIVAILAGFKYSGMLADLIHASGKNAGSLVMPVGISYYSFREISYLADIRMGKRKAEWSFLRYGTYIMFFPQMLSGPIARSEKMTACMEQGLRFDRTLAGEGVLLILSGMFKKAVIADRISGYVGTIFGDWQSYSSVALWVALFLNAVYIYCDFAGYSEIAVGMTRLFGIPCDLNFHLPYLARNMKEFWRRWHISLSQWLRDYVYIPLGGNRVSKARTKWNVMAVFVVCGLWHGSGLTYLLWGIYHGVLNILTPRKKETAGQVGSWSAFGCSCLVFIAAMFGWLLFRSDSVSMAAGYFIHLFAGFSVTMDTLTQAVLPFTWDNSCAAYALTAFLMILILFVMEWEERYHEARWKRMAVVRNSLMLCLVILFGVAGSGGFLYANY